MKIIDEYRYTGNSSVYRKARKWYLESVCEIRCAYCRYHKGENDRGSYGTPQSWKKHRKTQYKVKNVG